MSLRISSFKFVTYFSLKPKQNGFFVRFFCKQVKKNRFDKKAIQLKENREKYEKIRSGFFVPDKKDPLFPFWEEEVMKGIKEIQAYNQMVEKMNQKKIS